MKYQEGVIFQIQSLKDIEFTWKFPNIENTQKVGELKVGDRVRIAYSKNLLNEKCYVLQYVDGTVSDFLSEKDIEIMMGKYNTYLTNKIQTPLRDFIINLLLLLGKYIFFQDFFKDVIITKDNI